MDDTETASYRLEQGKSPDTPDPRARMADVPLAPSSAGAVGAGAEPEPTTADADRAAAEARQAGQAGQAGQDAG